MPYVNIKLAGKLTTKQKKTISKKVTKVIAETTGKPKESILLILEEADRGNVAKAGKLLSEK